ncbi:uncharacterized protein [Typha latifolia]|uniref:uncharacterized protein n=1 Tax=Typha latifolia TaxID=4733 RepID=UPI003C2F45C7
MGQNWSSFIVPAEGISGGLIMLWKTAFGYVDVLAVSRYAAHMVVSSREGETWLMTQVYASNQLDQQKLLWDELVGLGSLGLPWIVAGDFNAILSTEEKRSYAWVTLGPKSSTFAKFVEEAGVCDLGYEGVPFTWCNSQLGDKRVWVRLDRALVNTDWVRKYPRSRVVHLDRSASDHAPLLVLIVKELLDHYEELRGPNKEEKWALLEELELPTISNEDRVGLLKPVDNDEILEALRSMPVGKAPGLDGLQAEVYLMH